MMTIVIVIKAKMLAFITTVIIIRILIFLPLYID